MPAVIAPSRIPNGSCVGINAISIFQKSGMNGESPFIPEASSADVAKYVAQSAKRPAMKPAIQRLAFNALNPLKVR